MSEIDMDRLPRMKDYLKAEDLNTDACVTLATEILREAAQELAATAVRAATHPDKDTIAHLAQLRKFYASDWFAALSCGLVDGPAVAREIERDAVRRVRGGTTL